MRIRSPPFVFALRRAFCTAEVASSSPAGDATAYYDLPALKELLTPSSAAARDAVRAQAEAGRDASPAQGPGAPGGGAKGAAAAAEREREAPTAGDADGAKGEHHVIEASQASVVQFLELAERGESFPEVGVGMCHVFVSSHSLIVRDE